MDTSETYINLCEKAKKIQKEWKPKEGDWYCYKDCMCGFPIYQVGWTNLHDWQKTDAGKDEKCTHCAYDYQSFGEIMYATKSGMRDALTGWFVYLPLQDQLQEMIGDFGKCQDILHEYLSSRVGCPMSELWPSPILSMEQLWLAFVMQEKYNKIWDGKDWVKEK